MSELFIDDSFPPSNLNLNDIDDDSVVWKRPKQIIENAQFVVNGVDKCEVQQGNLGDCWFIAAISDLATKPFLLEQVMGDYDFDSEEYDGKVTFNFWYYGDWIKVTIDDLLPTINNKLIFCSSKTPNEFWCSLLEKAYAKFNGSYASLAGGFLNDAVVDFSGGVSFMPITLKDRDSKEIFELFKSTIGKNYLYGASISGGRETDTYGGLIEGHQYGITGIDVIKVGETEETIIRLRNPWGNSAEWNLEWSDKSDKWNLVSEEEKTRIAFIDKADGEFWMPFDKFMELFSNLQGAYFKPPSKYLDFDIYFENIHGKWIKNVSSGGNCSSPNFAKNDQYLLILEDDNCDKLILSLIQKIKRSVSTEAISKYLYVSEITDENNVLTKKYSNQEILQITKPVSSRIVYTGCREFSLNIDNPKKYYLLIPSLYEEGKEAEYLLRIFSHVPHRIIKLHEKSEQSECIKSQILGDIEKASNDVEEFLTIRELQQFIFEKFKLNVSLQLCRNLLNLLGNATKISNSKLPLLVSIINYSINLFDKLDRNKNNILSYDELQSLTLPSEFWEMYLNDEGNINFEDFVEMIASCMSSASF